MIIAIQDFLNFLKLEDIHRLIEKMRGKMLRQSPPESPEY